MTQKTPYVVAAGPSSTNLTEVAGKYFWENYEGCALDSVAERGNYLALIPAITTYSFLSDFRAPFNPGHHILDLIDPRITNDAAEGRCILVFDTSSEGDPLVEAGYANLHGWLSAKGIAHSSVLIINQNRSYQSNYNSAYGDGVRFLVYDSYIKRILEIFGASDRDFEVKVGFSRSRTGFRCRKSSQAVFLSLNGAPRANRIVAIAGMKRRGLLGSTVWSMLGERSGKLAPSYNDARIFRSAVGMEWIDDEAIEAVMAQMPKFIPIESDSMSSVSGSDALALKINADLYDLAFCSVATETEFTDGSVSRISELSLKPIMMGHPLVSVGNPGSLRLIRDIGFETFSNAIDEGYDEIVDPGERLSAIYRSMEGLEQKLLTNEATALEEALRRSCEHNVEFAKGPAIAAYEERVERPLIDGLLEHQARTWGTT